MAKQAVDISSNQANIEQSLNGKLVATSGIINTATMIADDPYLSAGKYLVINRRVEMYSWREDKKSQSQSNTGGSETTQTTYTYTKVWQENSQSGDNFRYPEGHLNPEKFIADNIVRAPDMTIGSIGVGSDITLPYSESIAINNEIIKLQPGQSLIGNNYIYVPVSATSTIENPAVGDLRISYQVLKPGFNGTIFGSANGSGISTYCDDKGNCLGRIFQGTKTDGIKALHSEYVTMSWILRLVGFIMMWVGFSLVFAPISVVLDFFPILGSISGFMIALVTFVMAFALSLVTIVVSAVIHNVIALIVAAVIVLVIIGMTIWGLFKKRSLVSNKT